MHPEAKALFQHFFNRSALPSGGPFPSRQKPGRSRKAFLFQAVPVCFLCLCLSGCMHAQELKQRTIIETIGVDKKDGEFVLTMQRFSPELQGGGSEVSTGSEKTTIVQTTGQSISDAVDKVTHYHGNEVFLGNSSFILIGRKAAEEDLENALSFFNSNHEISPEIAVVMAETTAEELVKSQAKQGGVSPAQVKNILQQGQKNGIMGRPTLRDIMNRLQSDSAEPYLPIMTVVKNGKDSAQLKISGMAVFLKGRLKDQLSIEETKGILWGTDEIEHSIITVKYGEKKETPDASQASVNIINSKTKVKVTLENGMPVIRLIIRSEGTIQEASFPRGGGTEIKEVDEIERLVEDSITNTLINTINKVFYQDHSDVFRYSEFIKRDQPRFWKAHENNWEELMEQCRFVYDVDCDIDRPGLETKHSQSHNNMEESTVIKG